MVNMKKQLSSNQINYAIGCRYNQKAKLIKKVVKWLEINGHRITRLEQSMFGPKLVIDKQVIDELEIYLEKN